MRLVKGRSATLGMLGAFCWLIAAFWGPLEFTRTPLSVLVGTLATTFGAVAVIALPAYIMAAFLAGIVAMPSRVTRFITVVLNIVAGMPSIVFGIIGFSVFARLMGFGWSILSAILTLALMLLPILVSMFLQILAPLWRGYEDLCRSIEIDESEFIFQWVPKMRGPRLLAALAAGWARALGETAAVMLTCGATLEMPTSILDPVRTLSYHIYLLALETPGGIQEAGGLCLAALLLVGVCMVGLELAFRGRRNPA